MPKDPDADSDAELVQCSENDSIQKNTRITGCRGRQRSKPGKQTVTGKHVQRAQEKNPSKTISKNTEKHWETLENAIDRKHTRYDDDKLA